MKKITAMFLAVLLALSVLPGLKASADNVFAPVSLNGAALDSEAYIDDGAVYLPIRSVCEALGFGVTWSDAGGVRKITVTGGGESVVLDLTNQRIDEDGHDFYAQSLSGDAVKLVSDKAYLKSDLFNSVFSLETDYDAETNIVTVRQACENLITISTEKTEAEEQYLKTTIQYPQISDLTDTAVQDAINSVFKQAALAAEEEGQKNAADMKRESEAGFPSGSKCETYFNYLVRYNRNGLLSIVLDDYQYTGGAHGSTVRSSYTFDLTSGKALPLEDLMRPGSGYAEHINSVIRNEIDQKEAAGELGELTGVRFSDIGSNPDYYISEDGIVFYFQQYEYFPYAAGIQEFTIPYDGLQDMLRPEYRFLYAEPVALTADKANALAVGDVGLVTLAGNPTTGYEWAYEISGENVAAVCASYVSEAKDGLVGAGGTYTWGFRALKDGEATITFRYLRPGEGAENAAQTVVYKITVD